ncbi:Hsp33 family molecular chaperone HslO [Halalkalibacterium halodurans]|jgi:molecular chaperone Hsp33|uniref:33 kDa chaperonin n=2 Tax=Halalkalibacterium halodurans TaxID=86665 RepID=HSLO_HALH5|nr:Hsp33 family molecular chaperone HslO [Halalkalibacterium halodurans]Q9KGH4.1 RecName: Full=33 kDa chaperonin; AltName: Full=Heat shock protein 33 homolog; Short=HSP33 [Halalkalibacterium halodurans C-125]MDY7220590.1 Hsp33 family molecular chaperone HslO [Halalkalibacterium halodurans]MDY7239829.1 Hsp33 family molecular chaperone HslO [Halalkalibacterium halodurans]MED3648139.1 Hsp33 family molecular chaperone HslO [Halalkalibacterium halodurans]MED4080440.1 Hsp33 family molecular chaperon
MGDYLVKALGFEGKVRAYALKATEMVNEAVRRQDTWPTASAALGRTMMAGTMMAAMLKGDAKLTVKVEGDGPIGAIIVDSQANGQTRGYVKNPHVHFELNEHGKLDVARAVGTNGSLSVVKDIGLRDHFTGSVPLVSGELGEDFTYYFVSSEQTPSSVGVGVLVNPDNSVLAAGGFVLQLMPGADDAIISEIEKRLQTIPPISKLVEAGMPPEEILAALLGDDNVKILEKMPIEFACQCSKERIARAIISLGKDEIRAMIEEDGGAETTCHFCNEVYLFSKEELETLYEEA